MIMIFRKFAFSLLFGFLLCLSYNAQAEIVSVEVNGYGADRQTAVTSALKEAISQVSGISLSSQDLVALTSSSSSVSVNDDTSEAHVLSKDMQSQIFSQTQGYVSSYRILSEDKDSKGMFTVSVLVEIEKYKVPGGDNNRRGVAVIGFKAKHGNCINKPLSAETQVESITNALVNSFTATRKFSVLDRDNDDVYALEKELALSEDAHNREVAKLGNVKATDYIVTGTVKSISIKSVKHSIELSGDVFYTKEASVEVDYRLIAFATKQVKFSSSVRVSLSNTELQNLECQEITSKLMAKAASAIVDACMENIYPALVVNVSGNSVYLNIGGEAVKKGDLYAVFAVGEKIIDPYTGESLGAEETQIAILEIFDVKPKYSVGKLTEGEIGEISKSQICRKLPPVKKATSAKKAAKKQKISDDDW